MEFQSGADLGPYRLIKRLGAGGMGEVWEAEDPRLGRTVAIKILPPGVAENNESKARLTREARTAAQLYHPNIATIHSIEQAGDRSFIVMEYVTGETLGELIRRGPMEESKVCAIGRKVASALEEAHEHGIVHRDIKPDNIVVSGDRVKVLDFGIAKQIGLEGISATDPTAFVTQAGMIVGTVQYMSPEQALGKPLDPRSDIFSLGVVLYQALTGKLPFEGETITETITRIIRDDPQPLRTINPKVSESMAAIIETCLDKNRDLRFSSAGELAIALDQQSSVAPTRPYTAPGVAVAAPPRATPLSSPSQATLPRLSAPLPSLDPAAQTIRDARPAPPTMPAAGPPTRKRTPAVLFAGVVVALLAVIAMAWHFRTHSAPARKPSAAGATVPVQPAPATAAAESTDTSSSSQPSAATTTTPPPASRTSVTSETTKAISTTTNVAASHGTASGTVVDVTAPAESQPPAMTTEASAPASTAVTSTEQDYTDGLRLMQRGDGPGALSNFLAALAIDPHAAPARLKVAQIQLRRHRPELAAAEFRQSLRDGDRLDAHDHLLAEMGLAVSERQPELAQQLIDQFKAAYPHDPQVNAMESELQWQETNGQDLNRFRRRRGH